MVQRVDQVPLVGVQQNIRERRYVVHRGTSINASLIYHRDGRFRRKYQAGAQGGVKCHGGRQTSTDGWLLAGSGPPDKPEDDVEGRRRGMTPGDDVEGMAMRRMG
jgi:hypothetical protein